MDDMREGHRHGCAAGSIHDREIPEVDLLTPLSLRGVTLRNRIAMSPMCQYSAEDGLANDWHFVHLGSRAAGGVGLVMVEATAVTPEGRITPGDLGLWSEAHGIALARIVRFIHSQGAEVGIQLAHAGRKASCDLPWKGGGVLATPEQGGWPAVAPSPRPFHEGDPPPKELTEEEMEAILDSFEASARWAVAAGFRVVELHAAHGYLLHEFLSPISNWRQDQYGGDLENRMGFPLRVADRLRTVLPDDMPLFVRISATDWAEGGWDIEQSVEFAKHLKALGVELVDVSSGGTLAHAHIPLARGYQVPFAERIRDQADIATGAVGLITDPDQANDIITGGSADLVLMGRELLRDPYWALKAQQSLGGDPSWPVPYGYAVRRRS
jgi:2,4-dienoyl-CoA reductase-like NADH-dependent reductase (Old Yellow Enzyme family)